MCVCVCVCVCVCSVSLGWIKCEFDLDDSNAKKHWAPEFRWDGNGKDERAWRHLKILGAVLELELRVLCLLGRFFTTWAMLPAPFLLYFADRVLCFLPEAVLSLSYLCLLHTCFFFGWEWDLNSGRLVLTKQAFYPLSHTTSSLLHT
jgi:hypothetical protein